MLKLGRSFEQRVRFLGGPDVLVCKLVDGKVTYVHRRLWPALIKLASRFGKERIARVWDEHTKSGAHVSRQMVFPDWVPCDVIQEAEKLSTSEAEQVLSRVLPLKPANIDRLHSR